MLTTVVISNEEQWAVRIRENSVGQMSAKIRKKMQDGRTSEREGAWFSSLPCLESSWGQGGVVGGRWWIKRLYQRSCDSLWCTRTENQPSQGTHTAASGWRPQNDIKALIRQIRDSVVFIHVQHNTQLNTKLFLLHSYFCYSSILFIARFASCLKTVSVTSNYGHLTHFLLVLVQCLWATLHLYVCTVSACVCESNLHDLRCNTQEFKLICLGCLDQERQL